MSKQHNHVFHALKLASQQAPTLHLPEFNLRFAVAKMPLIIVLVVYYRREPNNFMLPLPFIRKVGTMKLFGPLIRRNSFRSR